MLKRIVYVLLLICTQVGNHSYAQDSIYYFNTYEPKLILPPQLQVMTSAVPTEFYECSKPFSYYVVDFNPIYRIARQNNKYGVMIDPNIGTDPSLTGDPKDTIRNLIPFKYDTIILIHRNNAPLFIIELDDKYGLISSENGVIWDIEYDVFKPICANACCIHKRELFYVEKDGKSGLLRSNGTIKVEVDYEKVNYNYSRYSCPSKDETYKVKLNGKFGVIDTCGQVLIPFKYDSILKMNSWYTRNYSTYITSINGYFGVVDTKDSVHVKHKYDWIYSMSNSYYAIKKNGKWGVISRNVEVVPIKYDSVQYFYGNKESFLVSQNYRWGVVDTTGNVLIPIKYHEITAYTSGVYGYRYQKRWGFIKSDGTHLTSARYDEIVEVQGDYALIKKYNKYGVFKLSTGKEIIPPLYRSPHNGDYLEWGYDEYDHIMCWQKDGKYGAIDSNGVIIVPFKYDNYFSTYNLSYAKDEDRIYPTEVWRNDKKYWVDSKGNEIFGQYSDYKSNWSTSYYFITYANNKYGLLNEKGKFLVSPIYDKIQLATASTEEYFLLFEITKKKQVGLMDSLGQVIIPCVYDKIIVINSKRYKAYKDDKVGIINEKHDIIEPFTYPVIVKFNGKVSVVKIDSKYWFVDKEGALIDSNSYNYFTNLYNGYYDVSWNNYHGICDSNGQLIITPIYAKIKFYDGSFGAVKSRSSYGFINGVGDTLCTFKFEKVKAVWKDFVCVRVNDKFGVVNKQGDIILPSVYSHKLNLSAFDSIQFLSVISPQGYGVIDSNCVEIIPSIYSSPVKFKFYGNNTYVILKKRVNNTYYYGVYNGDGKQIVPDYCTDVSDEFLETTGLLKVKIEHYGLYDLNGNKISEFKYGFIVGKIEGYSDQFNRENLQPYLIYFRDGFYGLLSIDGEELTEAIYLNYQYDSVSNQLQLFKKRKGWINVTDLME